MFLSIDKTRLETGEKIANLISKMHLLMVKSLEFCVHGNTSWLPTFKTSVFSSVFLHVIQAGVKLIEL